MKTVIFALLVLLAISQGEALRCNCAGTHKHCSNPVETCHGLNDVCARVFINAGSSFSYFKSCMKASDCWTLNRPPLTSAYCCSNDLCN